MVTKNQSKHAVLVTGGAKRIGQAICLKLAELGFDVAIHYNGSAKEAKNLAKKIQANGAKSKVFKCNLTNEKDVSKLIGQVKKGFPNIKVLINNASVFEKSTLRKSSLKTINRDIDVHLKSPLILTRDFANKVKSGHIINILDTHITQCATQHFTYLLSKKALHELTNMSAIELAPKFRVNAIAPGLILPPENKQTSHLNRLAKNIPLKKRGDISNITQTIEFLLNNNYVTGQTIFCDGGEHLI